MRKIIIQDEIFEMYPDFYRGLVVVSALTNPPSLKRVRKLLKREIETQVEVDVDHDERLRVWDEAHIKFGSDPSTFSPSIKSLIKRIQKNPALPYINTVVALFNYISLKYCLPCGGDDMKAVEGDFVLGIADSTETFLPLGSDKIESPEKGEVIYFDSLSKNVMCRRWNWRNGEKTKIDVSTSQIIINIDCLSPNAAELVSQARDELVNLLTEHCGATLSTGALYAGNCELKLDC